MTAPSPRPLIFALLRQLSDGEFQSGQALARQFGVSRASVHNALREVEQFGLMLYRIPRRGYRLPRPPEWLEVARLRSALGELADRFHLQLLDSTSSTNALLLKQAAQGAPSGTLLAAEWQEAGRGRFGRPWVSGLGNALTFSLLWRFSRGVSGLSGLSLAVGVALVRALKQLELHEVALKWPNDLLGKDLSKLGGILLEAQGDMLGPSAVVIGIGLNLFLPETVLEQVDQPMASLTDSGEALPDRNLLLATILIHLQQVLEDFSRLGFAPFQSEWTSYHAGHGKTVRILSPDGAVWQGVARDVTLDGALQLETDKELRIFNAGEVSLRWA